MTAGIAPRERLLLRPLLAVAWQIRPFFWRSTANKAFITSYLACFAVFEACRELLIRSLLAVSGATACAAGFPAPSRPRNALRHATASKALISSEAHVEAAAISEGTQLLVRPLLAVARPTC